MSYILVGDSGTVVFERTGTVTGEDATMSTKVTSNPIEGGGNITDHAALDPVKFNISGLVNSRGEYKTLESMWRNRDLLTYRGDEAYDNLLITSFQRTGSLDNQGGFGFKISFQQMNISSSAFVELAAPTMSQADSSAPKAASAVKSTKKTTQNGLTTSQTTTVTASGNNDYAAYVAGFNTPSVNTSVAEGRSNPSYAGYKKGG